MSQSPQCLQELHTLLQDHPRRVLDVPQNYRRAAILIPLFQNLEEWFLLFTRRTEKVTHHKNEISFPGGRYDKGVDKSLVQTAIREANEEIGCEEVDVLGILDDIFTVSQYVVTPVVGYIIEDFDAKCANHNSDEIEYVLKVSLNQISDYKKYWTEAVPYEGGNLIHVPFFNYGGEIIWGATGRILANFLNLLTLLDLPCQSNMIGLNQWEIQEDEDYSKIFTKG
ncbi:MAG: NUDIX hydrolase [Candidatus Hodarchaeales archaeon]|jgi:8-oxo-dGTP pyrophosphatase MutT (NUDIX family)